jgi:hypothetical protein
MQTEMVEITEKKEIQQNKYSLEIQKIMLGKVNRQALILQSVKRQN